MHVWNAQEVQKNVEVKGVVSWRVEKLGHSEQIFLFIFGKNQSGVSDHRLICRDRARVQTRSRYYR